MEGQISNIEKDYNEFKLQYNKESVEKILIHRAVKTTIQILYGEGLLDNYANADKTLEDFLFTTRQDSQYLQLFRYLYYDIPTIIRVFLHMFHNCDNTIIRVIMQEYTYKNMTYYFVIYQNK